MATHFEKTFADLKKVGEIIPSAAATYELLKDLNTDTSPEEAELQVTTFRKIQYASNIESFFNFYLPIVTHILHYLPTYETDILHYLIGPCFAGGTMETKALIPLIQRSMEFKLSNNPHDFTEESKEWVTHELPKMEAEVEREVQICRKDLEE